MHDKFQFEGLCAVIQPDWNKVDKCEKQDVFLQIIAVFQRCSNLPSFETHLAIPGAG